MTRRWTLSCLLLLVAEAVAELDRPFKVPLYGDKLKGFMTVENVKDDEYVLSFAFEVKPEDARLALHMAIAPYDSGVMGENCLRARKSPHILRDQPIQDTPISLNSLSGHTVVIGNADEVYACATVIMTRLPLLVANFHADPVQGPIHIVPMKDKVRILPDLKYTRDGSIGVEIIDWAFVEKCDSQNAYQNAVGMELGVDSRATLSIETSGFNISLINFELFKSGKSFACAPIVNVERRSLRAGPIHLSQPHYFVTVKSDGNNVEELRIREDCLDLATETVHEKFANYFPTISIFGPETVMLKAAVVNGSCHTLRPQFPLPSAIADFFHPAFGRIVLVDTDDRILLTGNLRSLFDDNSARATVQISPKFAPSSGCPLYLDDCPECFTVQDAAVIVGRNDSDASLIGVLPHFDIQQMRSVIVDLQWTEEPLHVCANLTYLSGGALQASISAKRYSPISAKTMANVVVLEFPANNFTEVTLNRQGPLDDVAVHSRPIDMTVTSGPPCGEQTIGPKREAPQWLAAFQKAIKDGSDSTSFTVPGQLISGQDNILGTSMLFTHKAEVYCGSFDLPEERRLLVAKFDDPIEGYVVLSQYEMAGEIPTEVSYELNRLNSSYGDKESFTWEFVLGSKGDCDSAEIFNPFLANDTLCSPTAQHLCPIGSATEKSAKLHCGAKRHATVSRLPLNGPFGVYGKTLRLTSSSTNETFCTEVIEMQEANFRWNVYSNKTLSEIQHSLAAKLKAAPFQIKVDYSRELFGGHCSIYLITILETPERIGDILTIFDVENRKFRDEEDLICAQTTTTPIPLPPSTTPRKGSGKITGNLNYATTPKSEAARGGTDWLGYFLVTVSIIYMRFGWQTW